MPRTKIVCTIGPSCDDEEHLRAMVRAGMSVARLNFSHGSHARHAETIARLREVAASENVVLPILGDLQGPKIRVGDVPGGGIELHDGDEVVLTSRETQAVPGPVPRIPLPHPDIIQDIQVRQRLLLDDGAIELAVTDRSDDELRCSVVDGGVLRSRKGVSLPGARLSIPALTGKDQEDARFAVEQELDFLALSFARTARDVELLEQLLVSLGADIPIIVKIEKPEALTHFDEILEAADGIMVARGDLGVETPPEQVPFSQKRIIKACIKAAKPVITATQMLESMIENPRPTRAEASDVANAILDGTTAVMLSGETASGRHPVEAVKMMARIAAYTEANLFQEESRVRHRRGTARNSAEAVSEATVEIADELGVRAIVTSSYSGASARLVARHRPRTPIVAITPNERVQRQMALLWGVIAVHVPYYNTTDEMIDLGTQAALDAGLASAGDTIVITAGIPPGAGQRTNMVDVHVIPG